MKDSNKIFKIVSVLSAIGIVLALYLLSSFYSASAADYCRVNETVNCDEVTQGSLSTIFGIPVAMVGLAGYAIILFSALTKRRKLALGMAAFGTVFCLRITLLEFFVVKVICPVCIACQIIMLVVFGLLLYSNFAKTVDFQSSDEAKQ